MEKFIFTFGYGQVPGAGDYCIIEAPDMHLAITEMQKRTLKYCSCYPFSKFDELFNLGDCHRQVEWDENFRGWGEV